MADLKDHPVRHDQTEHMHELLPHDDLELDEEDLRGAGLTGEEIAASSEMGAWAGDEMQSGAEYVEKIRRASPRHS